MTPFVQYFTLKFKCVLGLFVTGANSEDGVTGLKIFNERGGEISTQVKTEITGHITNFAKSQLYLGDLS